MLNMRISEADAAGLTPAPFGTGEFVCIERFNLQSVIHISSLFMSIILQIN